MDIDKIVKEYSIVRKSIDYSKQIPRTVVRLQTSAEEYLKNPPVIVNSFPKSGTHLLFQIIKTIPNLKNYGSFIATKPSLTFKERSKTNHLKLISRIVPGEVLRSHLFFNEEFNLALKNKNCVHFFIYRDPRDVVVSDAYYLGEINKWHRMHRYFKQLKTTEERILRAITGFEDDELPYSYPNIARRFSQYEGWLKESSVYPVRYEDLISSKKQLYYEEIIQFYYKSNRQAHDINEIMISVEEMTNPVLSHTFRSGGQGNWRNEFTDMHKDMMKNIAGDLIIKLGYEKDDQW
jgi:hypothetical protein